MRPEDGAALAALRQASCRRARAGLRDAWPDADALDAPAPAAFLSAARSGWAAAMIELRPVRVFSYGSRAG